MILTLGLFKYFKIYKYLIKFVKMLQDLTKIPVRKQNTKKII